MTAQFIVGTVHLQVVEVCFHHHDNGVRLLDQPFLGVLCPLSDVGKEDLNLLIGVFDSLLRRLKVPYRGGPKLDCSARDAQIITVSLLMSIGTSFFASGHRPSSAIHTASPSTSMVT